MSRFVQLHQRTTFLNHRRNVNFRAISHMRILFLQTLQVNNSQSWSYAAHSSEYPNAISYSNVM